jgi:hypothetical protein
MHRFWECRYTHWAWDYTQEIMYDLVNKAKPSRLVLDFCCSHHVPIMFPSGSQWVLNIYIGHMSREWEITTYLIWDFPKLEFIFFKLWWANQRCPSQNKNWTLGVPTTNFKWVIIEFSVKLGKHSIRTLGLVRNRVRLKKNLQKSTLAFKGVKLRNAPFFVVNWVSSYFDPSLSFFLSAPPLLLLHIFSLILPVQLL